MRLPRTSALLIALAGPALAIAQTPPLTDYSLEQLLDVRIDASAAARKPQRLEDAAAAIHVITREDIRRSGMTSLPEVLRLAPGLQVARLDGGTWAVSSRGFNAKNSDNLLVMMDGRVLHSPTFTGVYWNAQDVVLEDVERIEVVRGPGGTLWGANAVTGVINIVTRPAAATQGGMVSLGAGSHERQATVRHGGTLGDAGHFRVYARSFGQDKLKPAFGNAAHDARGLSSAGFRADWNLSGGRLLTVQGDYYRGVSDHSGSDISLAAATRTPIGYPIDLAGGNLLARWTQILSAAEQWSLQFYRDYYQRDYFNLGERRATTDLDFQHRTPWGGRHDIVWGLGYRHTADAMANTAIVSFTPARRSDHTFSAFLQDEIALAPDKLYLTAGAKVEHNGYTGTEWQPNLRLRWKVDARQTAWAAVSRAVHTPSRTDTDGQVVSTLLRVGPATHVMRLQGNPAVTAETLHAYEAGWRMQPTARLDIDIAAFRNEHRQLMTIEREASFVAGGYTILPFAFHNRARATTHGIEANATWRPDDRWQFRISRSWLKMNIRRDADSTDTSIETEVGRSPQHQFQFHAFHALSATVVLNASLYRVGELRSLDIPAYTRVDAGIAWRPRHDLELGLTGRNLLDPGHPEFLNPSGPRSTEVPRSLLATATWRF